MTLLHDNLRPPLGCADRDPETASTLAPFDFPDVPVPTASLRPTLRTVADRVGVSRMTVSRALRGDPSLSNETIARVRKAAAEVGFRPDPKLTELMAYLRRNRGTTSREVIAYVNTFPAADRERHLSRTEERMLEGARARADDLGYGLEVFTMESQALSARRLSRIAHTRGIEGIVIQASRGEFDGLNELADRFGTCVIGTSQPDLPLHVACNHHAHTMHTALENLRITGHRRIGYYMTTAIEHAVGHAWHSALLHHLQVHGPHLWSLANITPDWNQAQFVSWLEHTRPDAVITLHLPALDWMQTAGFRVPDDSSYVHLDWCSPMPDCAGVDQRTEQVGAAAVNLVTHQMQHHETGLPASQHTVLVKGIWRSGTTVRSRVKGAKRSP